MGEQERAGRERREKGRRKGEREESSGEGINGKVALDWFNALKVTVD
jgi:hypothetical protein